MSRGASRRIARMVMRPAASRATTSGGLGGGGPWMATGWSGWEAAAGVCAACACADQLNSSASGKQ